MSGYAPSEEEVRGYITEHKFREFGERFDRFLAEDRRKTAEPLLARVATLEAQVAAVREAVDDCPPCDVHPDGDPITCGWKGAVADVRKALDSAATS